MMSRNVLLNMDLEEDDEDGDIGECPSRGAWIRSAWVRGRERGVEGSGADVFAPKPLLRSNFGFFPVSAPGGV